MRTQSRAPRRRVDRADGLEEGREGNDDTNLHGVEDGNQNRDDQGRQRQRTDGEQRGRLRASIGAGVVRSDAPSRIAMNLFAPVAIWGFWILLAAGWAAGELQLKGSAVFLLLWLAALSDPASCFPGALFMPYVAVLDIALVFTIFKGDITLH